MIRNTSIPIIKTFLVTTGGSIGKLYISNYLPKQLAAVRMKFGDIIVPPQKIGPPVFRNTCQGHCPGVLSCPPSILLKFALFFCFFLDACVLEELAGLSDFSPHSISNQKMKLITDTYDKLHSNVISRIKDF